MDWNTLESLADLETAIALSSKHMVIIFKHSRMCSLSSMALRSLEGEWSDAEMENVKAFFLDLISYREVSNEIARRLEVVHQSPQLLILKNGICVHNASHLSISYKKILSVIASYPTGPLF